MGLKFTLNRATSLALAYLLGLSLRLLSLHQLAFLLIPFFLVTDTTSMFLVNIALIPLALLLLLISALVYAARRVVDILRTRN